MFEFVQFKKEHLTPLLDQPTNAHLRSWIQNGNADIMEKQFSRTLLADGVPLICGGVTQYWEGRGQVWTIFNENCKANFLPVFRVIRRFLAEQPCRRLEMCVPVDLEKGHRRARMLGFKLECPLAPKYLPDGSDCSLYSLVRT